jgi:hypothetical protein
MLLASICMQHVCVCVCVCVKERKREQLVDAARPLVNMCEQLPKALCLYKDNFHTIHIKHGLEKNTLQSQITTKTSVCAGRIEASTMCVCIIIRRQGLMPRLRATWYPLQNLPWTIRNKQKHIDAYFCRYTRRCNSGTHRPTCTAYVGKTNACHVHSVSFARGFCFFLRRRNRLVTLHVVFSGLIRGQTCGTHYSLGIFSSDMLVMRPDKLLAP